MVTATTCSTLPHINSVVVESGADDNNTNIVACRNTNHTIYGNSILDTMVAVQDYETSNVSEIEAILRLPSTTTTPTIAGIIKIQSVFRSWWVRRQQQLLLQGERQQDSLLFGSFMTMDDNYQNDLNSSSVTFTTTTASTMAVATFEATATEVAVTKFQSLFRGWFVRESLLVSSTAAIIIQTMFRGWYVRDTLELEHYCSIIIQKAFRKYYCRYKYQYDLYRIITVQSICRGYQVRNGLRMFQSFWNQVRMDTKTNNPATSTIPNGRNILYGNDNAIIEDDDEDTKRWLTIQKQHFAAIIIQTNWRTYIHKLFFSWAIADVIRTQSIVRRWLANRRLQQHVHNDELHYQTYNNTNSLFSHEDDNRRKGDENFTTRHKVRRDSQQQQKQRQNKNENGTDEKKAVYEWDCNEGVWVKVNGMLHDQYEEPVDRWDFTRQMYIQTTSLLKKYDNDQSSPTKTLQDNSEGDCDDENNNSNSCSWEVQAIKNIRRWNANSNRASLDTVPESMAKDAANNSNENDENDFGMLLQRKVQEMKEINRHNDFCCSTSTVSTTTNLTTTTTHTSSSYNNNNSMLDSMVGEDEDFIIIQDDGNFNNNCGSALFSPISDKQDSYDDYYSPGFSTSDDKQQEDDNMLLTDESEGMTDLIRAWRSKR